MAITQTERIFDLAYGAKYEPGEIANTLNISQLTVLTALQNLAAGPSTAVSPAASAEVSAGGISSLLFGNLKQVSNTSRPARSNMDYLGYGNNKAVALVKTKFTGFVTVPVRPGDIFSKVGILTAQTAMGTPEHQCVSVYEHKPGKGKLIQQSLDVTTAAIAAFSLIEYTLEATITVTEANAANGFMYVGWAYEAGGTEATTVNGVLTANTQQLLNKKEGFLVAGAKETPLFLSATAKPSAEPGIKAESEIKEGTATLTLAAEAPFMFLY